MPKPYQIVSIRKNLTKEVGPTLYIYSRKEIKRADPISAHFWFAIVVLAIIGFLALGIKYSYSEEPPEGIPWMLATATTFLLTSLALEIFAVLTTPLGWSIIYSYTTQHFDPSINIKKAAITHAASILSAIILFMGSVVKWFTSKGIGTILLPDVMDIAFNHFWLIVLATNATVYAKYAKMRSKYNKNVLNRYDSIKALIIESSDKNVRIRIPKGMSATAGILEGITVYDEREKSYRFDIRFHKIGVWIQGNYAILPKEYFLSTKKGYMWFPAILVENALFVVPVIKNVDYELHCDCELRAKAGQDYARVKVEKKHIDVWYSFLHSQGVSIELEHTPSGITVPLYETKTTPFIQYAPEFDKILYNKLLVLPSDELYALPNAKYPKTIFDIYDAIVDQEGDGILAIGEHFKLKLTLRLPLQPDVSDSAPISVYPHE